MAFSSVAVTNLTASTNSPTITIPAVSAGDRLLVLLVQDAAGGTFTPSTNAGRWSLIATLDQASPDSQTSKLYNYVVVGDEGWGSGGTQNFSASGTRTTQGVVWKFTGRSSDAVTIGTTTVDTTSNGTSPRTITIPAVTAASGDDLLAIVTIDKVANDTWVRDNWGNSFTERHDENNGSWCDTASATKDNVGAGTTGTVTVDMTRTVGTGTTGQTAVLVSIPASASGSYSLTADQGIYSIAGQAANLINSGVFSLSASNGLYSINGSDGTSDITFAADTTTYSITGQNANLTTAGAVTLVSDSGSYAISGQATAFLLSNPTVYTLVADMGTYIGVGRSANLLWPQDPTPRHKKHKMTISFRIGL